MDGVYQHNLSGLLKMTLQIPIKPRKQPIGIVSFFKIAQRPRFAMIRSQGEKPKPRLDLGPIDFAKSFGFEVAGPDEAKRVAKACRNLVRPLARMEGGVTWLDERAIPYVLRFLRAYRHFLRVKRLSPSRFCRTYPKLDGTKRARRVSDEFLRDCERNRAKRHATWLSRLRPCGLYLMRERKSSRRCFKIGISCCVETRAQALKARQPRVLRTFATKEIAHAVEQGLHALLQPFRDRRPRQHGVHGGDTEWYRPLAEKLIKRAAAYFSKHVATCAAERDSAACGAPQPFSPRPGKLAIPAGGAKASSQTGRSRFLLLKHLTKQ